MHNLFNSAQFWLEDKMTNLFTGQREEQFEIVQDQLKYKIKYNI